MNIADIPEIEKTDIWSLYEESLNYCRQFNMFEETRKNYRFYNGNQWEGLKVTGVEPVQLNFIKPVVKYKVGTINSNLWKPVFTSENFENEEFRNRAEEICNMLDKKVSKVWEKDSLDVKIRRVSKDSAINSEGIMYADYDMENQTPVNEIIKKTDIFFGNENDSDIQSQPYILIKRRVPVSEARTIAEQEGVPENKLNYIVGDNQTFESSGDDALYEKDDMCTIVTKMYKDNGTIHFSRATKFVELKKDTDSGLSLYPVAHFLWEQKEGSARGEGEVKYLIPNQIEVNKTEMRRILTIKYTAYPQKIINTDKVMNADAAETIGGVIKTKNGANVEDVNRIFGIVQPAQMSPDVQTMQNELISYSRELSGAGDIATGDVNPETASGKAILAVQQASQQPLTEQELELKNFIEDMSRIWLDMFITYSDNGLNLEEEVTDQNGNSFVQLTNVPQEVLKELQATVKVEVTPKGVYDKYAQELSLENLLKGGYFNIQRLPELKVYESLLDDDSVMRKDKLQKAIEEMEAEQEKIAQINAQAQIMQQRANQFLNNDAEAQRAQLESAQQSINQTV